MVCEKSDFTRAGWTPLPSMRLDTRVGCEVVTAVPTRTSDLIARRSSIAA